jgi:hypothetical protein
MNAPALYTDRSAAAIRQFRMWSAAPSVLHGRRWHLVLSSDLVWEKTDEAN